MLTGGEPTLQVDAALVAGLHGAGWLVAVETNGTVDAPAVRACDWVCLSPKRGTAHATLKAPAHEVKVVLPGGEAGGWTDHELAALSVDHPRAALFVQPQDGPGREANLAHCVAFVMDHPAWRLSVQVHKIVGLP